jgi:muconolactone D-isomerase
VVISTELEAHHPIDGVAAAGEDQHAADLQNQGVWLHLWRVVGEYANCSVFDVESNDALHNILAALPLFPYMRIQVTALAQHPSSIR